MTDWVACHTYQVTVDAGNKEKILIRALKVVSIMFRIIDAGLQLGCSSRGNVREPAVG